MSKLDIIILSCANKVLDGKQEKLGDYIDPTKQEVKDLMLELIGETDFAYKDASAYAEVLKRKVNEL